MARLRDGTVLHECPGRMLTPETAAVCRLYPLLECGVLPCSGGALEQPATLMSALAVVAVEVGKYRDDEAEKARDR